MLFQGRLFIHLSIFLSIFIVATAHQPGLPVEVATRVALAITPLNENEADTIQQRVPCN